MEILALAALFLILLAGSVFIWWQSKANGRFGLGKVGGTNCPRCGTRLPMIRKPSSPEEAMWGGWACPKCGCKVDKYGKERAAG